MAVTIERVVYLMHAGTIAFDLTFLVLRCSPPRGNPNETDRI